MRVSDAVALITERAEAEGLLLVHDQSLPSVTSLVCGEPIPGSWWSHPLANVIYTALEELDDRFATCKLVSKKLTLVAPRLWPDLTTVGGSKEDWQLDELSTDELALLDRVEASSVPVVIDQPSLRSAGRRLEDRLLVSGEEIHSDTGRHLKALVSWRVWGQEHGVDRRSRNSETARARFEDIVSHWDPGRSLLPWPTSATPS